MSQEYENQIIKPVDLDREMRKSYIAYAMSVIVGRALPDVRDGLKFIAAFSTRCTRTT